MVKPLIKSRRLNIKGYYFITDSGLSAKGNVSDVKAALEAGVEVVQYRNKNADTLCMYEEAAVLRKLCTGILFLINDRLDIALAVEADGVHLGQKDLPYRIARNLLGKNKIIGLTVHNLKEAEEAKRLGADYIAVSPIFATTTKLDAGSPCGTALIRRIRKNIALPIVAIGGITITNAQEVILAGADALCSISSVVGSPYAASQMFKFQGLF